MLYGVGLTEADMHKAQVRKGGIGRKEGGGRGVGELWEDDMGEARGGKGKEEEMLEESDEVEETRKIKERKSALCPIAITIITSPSAPLHHLHIPSPIPPSLPQPASAPPSFRVWRQVGISSVWYEGNTCNMHLLELAEAVKGGVTDAGLVGFRFNTIGVSDGISMGTDGMSYSLQSRDLIADSIETVMAAQWYDANISIPGCDKNMPGTVMAMARLNRPAIMIYGGTIKPGHFEGATLDIVNAFQVRPPSPSLALPLPPSPSLSLPRPPSPSLALPLPPSPSLSLPLPPSPSLSLPRPPSPSLSLALPLPPSPSLSLPRPPSPSPSLSLALPLPRPPSPSPSLSLALPLPRPPSPSPSLSLALPLPRPPSPSPSLSLALPLPRPPSPSASLSLASPSLSLALPLPRPPSPSPSLSLALPLPRPPSPSPRPPSPSPSLSLALPLPRPPSPSPSLSLALPLPRPPSPSPSLSLALPLPRPPSPSPCLSLGLPLHSFPLLSYGEFVAGRITEEERQQVVRHSCPGQGACGGMYTANTMASAIEALGLTLPYSPHRPPPPQLVNRQADSNPSSCTPPLMHPIPPPHPLFPPHSSSIPAEDPLKLDECRLAGAAIKRLLELDVKPRDIITREALENAITTVIALGGSTNAVLHLIAIARAVGLSLTLDDFQAISDRVPFIADLKPSGKYVMEDVHKIGGTPAVLKYLLEKGLLHGDCLTVTGKTLAENLASVPPLSPGQDVIRPLEEPIKQTGHLQILYGNLAPEGSVAKITGKEGLYFKGGVMGEKGGEGPALVFEGEEAMLEALSADPNSFKGAVVVIRGEGPKGGPGMPEMLTPTSAIMGAGLGKPSSLSDLLCPHGSLTCSACPSLLTLLSTAYLPHTHQEVALLTDGRFSGGSHGFVVGHVCPEAQVGGPIGLVQNRDVITIDMENRAMDMAVSEVGHWGLSISNRYPSPFLCAQVGGPIGLVQNGDVITIDVEKRTMDMDVSDEELQRRRANWVAPPLKATRGTLYKVCAPVQKSLLVTHILPLLTHRALCLVLPPRPPWPRQYIKTVKSASEGCVTDE
ncbi:unnamed protein product [Closterium sp. NIES-65]|nr:unnamed protein product [Closterium sp. NIES-65]